jgi:hypothetical protein
MTVAVAVLMAARSTWSPCGISMLSTLTPLSERGRGHRYGLTVAWYVAGAVVGGAVLGAGLALCNRAIRELSLSPRLASVIVALLATVTIASDRSQGGLRLPVIARQVDENWIGRYRRWVYASGFGVQIGFGFATYVMTAGLYLLVGLAVLVPGTAPAFLVGASFGLCRGLAILLGAGLDSPAAIRRFHGAFEAMAPRTMQWAVLVQANVLAVAASLAVGVTPGWAVAGLNGVVIVTTVAGRRATPAPQGLG